VATGGETSVSGTDADGKTLSYTVGLEQVFLNGVNLVRGQDYTATNGTSVGSLTALVASDVVEVFAYVPFNIANALTVSTVDAKGDLLVGTGADAVGRLAVGTDGKLLSAASGETSGLKWANGGMTLIKTETFSASAAVNVDDVFSSTYENYCLIINHVSSATDEILRLRLRVSATDASGSNYGYQTLNAINTTVSAGRGTANTSWDIFRNDTSYNGGIAYIYRPNVAATTQYSSQNAWSLDNARISLNAGSHTLSTAYTGFTLVPNSGTITGTISTYGINK
jgi:hypothetical protein